MEKQRSKEEQRHDAEDTAFVQGSEDTAFSVTEGVTNAHTALERAINAHTWEGGDLAQAAAEITAEVHHRLLGAVSIPPTLWEAPVTVRAGRYLDSIRGSERRRMANLEKPKSGPALAVHAAEAVMRAPRLHATGDLDGTRQQHARATELARAGLEAARPGSASEAFLKALLVDLEAPCAEVCGHSVCRGWLSCRFIDDEYTGTGSGGA